MTDICCDIHVCISETLRNLGLLTSNSQIEVMTVHGNEVQLQLYARAPAPSRDYYGLTITQTKIILNIWNISYGPHVYPKRHVSSLEEFANQRYMQHDIQRTFGDYALQFARCFAAKERNLQCLPIKVFLKIVRYLATNDILRLSQTSKIFFDICNSEAIWKVIYKKRIRRRVMLSDIEKGMEVGWKEALKAKIMSRITLRNLLDKNEAKIKPAVVSEKNQMNNLTSNTTSDTRSNRASISRVTINPNTSNKSTISLIKNQIDTPKETNKRFSKSAADLQKSPSSNNSNFKHHKKLSVPRNHPKDEDHNIALPINKTKLLQNSITLRPTSLGRNLEKDLEGLLRKTNYAYQKKPDKNISKSNLIVSGKKSTNNLKK